MKVQFWGAAQTVTGSMHLLEVNGRRILLAASGERVDSGSTRISETCRSPPPKSMR